jgi:hypothetical protein
MIHVFRIEKPTGIFTPPGSSFASCVGSIEKIASFIHAAINEIPEKHRSCSERNFAKPHPWAAGWKKPKLKSK